MCKNVEHTWLTNKSGETIDIDFLCFNLKDILLVPFLMLFIYPYFKNMEVYYVHWLCWNCFENLLYYLPHNFIIPVKLGIVISTEKGKQIYCI